MRSRWQTLPVLLLVGSLVAAACGQTATPAPAPSAAAPAAAASAPPAAPAAPAAVAGGNFRFGQSGDISALDPWNVTDGNSLLVTRQIFETLVDYEPTGFKLVPKLATKWEASADGKTWTFTLRDGVKFHDGTAFDAAAVVTNFDRAKFAKHELRPSKPVADDFAYFGDMWNGFDNDSVIAKVEAKSANTVVFTLKTSFGPFLANMAMSTFGLVSPKSMKDDKDGFMLPATKGVAGTGPFTFKPGGWLKGQSLTLDKNADYWDTGKVGLDKVTFRFIADTAARIAALKAGTVDAIRDFAPADLPAVKADPNLQVIPRPAFNVAYIGVNLGIKPFDNLGVRKAVAMAINKQAIVAVIYAGEARVASQFLVRGMVGYDESVTDFYKYDEAGAKKALADAGFPNGFETELWYMPVSPPYYPDPKKIAEAFASDLAKVGIKAALKTEDWTPYRKDARENKFGLWLLGWTGDNGDPDNFLNVFFKPKVVDGKDTPIEAGAWSNPQAWDLLRKAAAETDNTKRAELYKQVSKIVQTDVARIPMFHANPPTAASKKVSGFVPHPTGGEAFTAVRLAK